MICQFKRLIYPRSLPAGDAGYMIALYKPCETILNAAGKIVLEIKAVGYCLPTACNVYYDFQGRWSKNAKHGVQFEVDTFQEVIVPTKKGIIAFLSSRQIKEIRPKTAEKIYQRFGKKTLEILDSQPEKLLEVSGVSENKPGEITEPYLISRGARDMAAFLAPYGITPNRTVKLYRQYGEETMKVVHNHPYWLCEMAGIGFRTVDKIAMNMGFDRLSPERVDEGLVFTLIEAEQKGHLCIEKREFISRSLKLLATEGLTEEMAAIRAFYLLQTERLATYRGWIYRASTARAEQRLAELVSISLHSGKTLAIPDITATLEKMEVCPGLSLNEEQKQAVTIALASPITILTGGPGTGKTLTQKALLAIYRSMYPNKKIICCAPTGRAARRMEESTGMPAETIHKVLGLLASEDGNYCEPEMLDADLVLVDEVSMMDIFLAEHLFRSIPSCAQLVLIGDADQLPSVGPGAVLSELIACELIPVVRLTKIYRQSYGSRIAMNAKIIRNGNLSLEYGEDFRFVESSNLTESAKQIEKIYLQEIDRYGVDQVALLTPYRQKTETGVNALNARLREKINPPSASKAEVTVGKRTLRQGDKVMQVKNHENVSNGDVGYIAHISRDGADVVVTVDFGDGRMMEYESSDLDMLDLAYASTIHKSQGCEYQSVIINLQCIHEVMLVRPLLYTAVTRAKKQVILVGERRALCIAIKRAGTERRGTMLATRIQESVENSERRIKMAAWLNNYQTMKVNVEQELSLGTMDIRKVMLYQELLYRIEVLQVCRMLCKTAPVTMEMKTMVGHYQLVDAYIQCISVERRFGMPADKNQKDCRKTAATALEKTVTDCRKRFSCFHPTEQEQYRRSIVTFINTVLPVWLQFRNTYTPINK